MRKIIIFMIVLTVIPFVFAQQSQTTPNQLVVLNNEEYTITYLPREVEEFVKVTQRTNPSGTQSLLILSSIGKNTEIGILKSGNIQEKTLGTGRNRMTVLEVSNRTKRAIFETNSFMINGTFRIANGESEEGIESVTFELDRGAVLTVLANDRNFLLKCRENDRDCLRSVEFTEKENFHEQYANLRGVVELIRPESNEQGQNTEEKLLSALQNVRGVVVSEGSGELGVKTLRIFGIPYLSRRPGSIMNKVMLQTENYISLEYELGANDNVINSRILGADINVYDVCTRQDCGLTVFHPEADSQIVFLSRNSPYLQALNGKIGVVERNDLYTECQTDPDTTCIKNNENGRRLNIVLNGDSKLKMEPLSRIRTLTFDSLIDDGSEVVVEGNNDRRLTFNRDGVKYSGPGAWYSLSTSFKIPVILDGKRHILECKAESQQCFVDGKLTMGPELKSCQSNEECGPQEKCSDNVCVLKQLCILHRGSEEASRTRADVVVSSSERGNEDLKAIIDNVIINNQGAMFQTAPFNSNLNAFNFWIMGRESNQNPERWHSSCPVADYMIVISNTGLSRANGGRRIAYISGGNIPSGVPGGQVGYLSRVITHEFGGHVIGRLGDEYTADGPFIPYSGSSQNCARTIEEARIKFGISLANQAEQNGWKGCGGGCDWSEYQCNEWYTVSQVDSGNRQIGTLTIMGDEGQYGEFNDFDRNIIQTRLGRRRV